MNAIGRWSIRHPWIAIAAWVAFVVLSVGALSVTGSKQLQNGEVGETAQSSALQDSHPARIDRFVDVHLHSDSSVASDARFSAGIAGVASELRSELGGATTVQISKDAHSALVSGAVDAPFDTPTLVAAVGRIGSAHGLAADVAGFHEGGGNNNDLQRAERLSVPVTLLVLLIAFGSLVAAIVPVLLAATAVLAAFGLLGPISHAFPLDSSVKTVVLLIGMAVGVDYALFYVVRSREERLRGASPADAVARAAQTSGRTVIVAGATVAVAMAAQFVVGSQIFNGIAAGTIAVVACAVAGSVTVLPALLRVLGTRIDRGRIPFLPHLHEDSGDARFWPGLIDRVLRRPVLAFALSAGLLVALALPALGLHVSKPESDPLTGPDLALAQTIAREFPSSCPVSSCTPATVAATIPPGKRAEVLRAFKRLESLAVARGVAHPPFQAVVSDDGQLALLSMPLPGIGDNSASRAAVATIRADLIPETLGRIGGTDAAMNGEVPADVDFTNQIKSGIPAVVAFVLVLAFLLLLVAFRSVVIPLKAIVLNLLSVAASYGVLVLVFQRHWAEGLLGFHSDGTIVSWLPLFLFVILFGLSMDYHVFILSRVREGVGRGLSTEEAIRDGVTRTAGVVTSAALVMVGVFSLFGTASSLDLKQAGIGLGIAVLLDATVIRGVLLPASMKLLGEWNWYLPSWLGWLPGGSREPEPRDVVAALEG